MRASTRAVALLRFRQWVLAVLSGLCCAVMAFAINVGIEGIEKLRFMLLLHLITPGGGLGLPWLAFVAASCAACLVATLGVVFLAPLAAGSGIQHIKAICNSATPPGFDAFNLRVLMVKGLGAMFSIGSGLIAGKEGPFIQCGACIAHLLQQLSEWLFRGGAIAGGGSRQGSDGGNSGSNSPSKPPQNAAASSADLTTPGCAGPADAVAAGAAACSDKDTAAASPAEQQRRALQPPSHSHQGSQPQLWSMWQQHDWQQREWARVAQRRHHNQTAMGAGAGVAAAFIAPLAGSAYSVEEAATHYDGAMLGQSFLAGGVTVCLLWLFTAASRVGSSGLSSLMFSSPLALAFRGSSGTDVRFWWYIWELPLMLLLGVFGALLAVLWAYLTTRLMLLRKRALKGSPAGHVLMVLFCCLITNSIRLFVTFHAQCLPVPPQEQLDLLERQVVSWQFFDAPTGLFPQLWCPAGHYNKYGLFLLPLEVSVRTLFTLQPPIVAANMTALNTPSFQQQISSASGPINQEGAGSFAFVFGTDVLAAYMAWLWAMLVITYGVAVPTGIFVPSLGIGAAGGRVMGQLLETTLRSHGIHTPICLPGWSVLGAAAMLTGATRLTLANCLIVLESSGAVPMSVPMVLLAVPAKLLADALFPQIYDYQIEEAGYAFLPPLEAVSNEELGAVHTWQVASLLGHQQQQPNSKSQQQQQRQQQQQWRRRHKYVAAALGSGAPAADGATQAAADVCAPAAAAAAAVPRIASSASSSGGAAAAAANALLAAEEGKAGSGSSSGSGRPGRPSTADLTRQHLPAADIDSQAELPLVFVPAEAGIAVAYSCCRHFGLTGLGVLPAAPQDGLAAADTAILNVQQQQPGAEAETGGARRDDGGTGGGFIWLPRSFLMPEHVVSTVRQRMPSRANHAAAC